MKKRWPRFRRTDSRSCSSKQLAACETLEPRLVLTPLLRPGAEPDSVVVAPAATSGWEATAGAVPLATVDAGTPLVVDVTSDTPGDQRYGYASSEQGPLFRVETNVAYTFTAAANPFLTNAPRSSFGYRSYDADRLEIEPIHVAKHAFATDTVLAATLQPEDRSLLIANASGWSNDVGAAAGTRALAWYGYRNSSGETYSDYTYTRNVATGGEEGLWQAGEIWFDPSVGAYRVPLHEAWQGPKLAAGSAVRNAAAGDLLSTPFPESMINQAVQWGVLDETFQGEWVEGRPDSKAFRPGTEFVQPSSSFLAGVWNDLAFGPAADFSAAAGTVALGASAGGFALELDVLAKGATSFTGDYNGDGRVDAADYTVWQDTAGSEAVIPHTGADGNGDGRIDESDLAFWRGRYGATTQIVIDSATAEIGTAAASAGVGGAVNYTAPQYFVGTDIVSYTLRDVVSGATFTSQVIVSSIGDNTEQDPTAVAELAAQAAAMVSVPRVFNTFYSTAVGESLAAGGLLENNRFAADRLVARLVSGPLHGTLDLSYDGTFRYTPKAGFVGSDAFHYEVFDGLNAIGAVATIEVLPSLELTRERLQKIGFGMLDYEGSFSRLPLSSTFDDNGNRLLSWRVHLLPFLGRQLLYERFNLDEPWDSPNNLPLAFEMPAAYRSAGDAADSATTRFQTFTGPDTPFGRLPDSEPQQGTRLLQFTDGTANTLLVVEAASDAAVIWTKPEDLVFDPQDPLRDLGTGPFSLAMADSSVTTVPGSINADDFAALVTFNGNELVDAAKLQREHYQAIGEPQPLSRFVSSQQDASLRSLAFAALNYSDVFGRFPISGSASFDEEGNPYLSWRVHLLPYLGHRNLYDRFNLDEPWDSPNNLPLLAEMPDLFRGPEDAASSTTTRYLRFTGPEAPFEYFTEGLQQRGPRFQDIRDGASKTLLFVEAAADRAAPWTKPEDLPFDRAGLMESVGSNDGIHVALFDGSTALLRPDIAPEDFAALVTRRGEELFNQRSLLADLNDRGETPDSRQKDLKQIVRGLYDYESTRSILPQDRTDGEGTRLLSWRVELLPFIGEKALYDAFRRDEPWDSPHNLTLLQYMPDVYRTLNDPADSTTTSVVRFTGPDTPYRETPEGEPIRLRFRDITDRTWETIAAIDAGAEVAVPWTQPADLPLAANPFGPVGDLGEEFVAAFFDGHVETLSSEISPSQLRALITPNGGEDRSDPPTIVVPAGVTVIAPGGEVTTNEFGVAVLYAVLDTVPSGIVTLDVTTSDAGVTTITSPPLTFGPDDWGTPQPIAVRAVENATPNADQAVSVTVSVDVSADPSYTALSPSIVSIAIQDDEPQPPALPGDFNRDGIVDTADYGLWRDQAGPSVLQPFRGADANGDGNVDTVDRAVWLSAYGATTAATTSMATAIAMPSAQSEFVLASAPTQARSADRGTYRTTHRGEGSIAARAEALLLADLATGPLAVSEQSDEVGTANGSSAVGVHAGALEEAFAALGDGLFK